MRNIISELEALKIDVRKIKTSGKTICPRCSHNRKNKKDPCLSVDVTSGVYNCHNCGFKGSVGNSYEPKTKEYVIPVPVVEKTISDKIVSWFFTERKISPQTLSIARVTDGKEYMPQTSKEENVIRFNYFRNEQLVNVKFRTARKHFKMVKDAELIFYGLDDIKDSDWCVIVEGEIDKLSFLELGIKEVISVPNGASSAKSPNLEYFDNCFEYFENKKRIILAMDNDEVGLVLRDEIARRIGFERCYKVDFKDCKDANEYLCKHGNELKEVINEKNVIPYPIEGIVTISDIWEDVEQLFSEGVKPGVVTGKIEELDHNLSFFVSQIMVLTGIPNHGKSPFALFLMATLSVFNGWKWGLFTPEHKPLQLFMVKLMELLIGRRSVAGTGFPEAEKQLAKSFINEHFFFIEPEDEDLTLDNILDKAKRLVLSKGIKGLLIDPWNKLEHNVNSNDTEHNYISKELDKIIRFDQRSGVFTIVVAHPKKILKQKNSDLFEVPNLYDISGSSNWYNKPDIGVTFYRDFSTGNSEVHIKKMKYEHQGKVSLVKVKYNINNGRFCGVNQEWDNTNWLVGEDLAIQSIIQPSAKFDNIQVAELPF